MPRQTAAVVLTVTLLVTLLLLQGIARGEERESVLTILYSANTLGNLAPCPS